MSVLRPWIAGYLVLCLAFAGAVGLNPFLHHLIEHGGQGHWHTHNGGHDHLAYQLEAAPAVNLAQAMTALPPAVRPVYIRTHRPFKLPTAQIASLIGSLRALLIGSPPSETGDAPGHEHHSLAQLLASGLAEQSVAMLIVSPFVPHTQWVRLTPDELLLASIWNAQTPDRGPPVS